MKKTISVILALVLCVALAAPAMAAAVPSVTREEEAKSFVVEASFGEGIVTEKIVVGTELDANGIPAEEHELLLDVIAQIEDGSMVLPLEEGFEIRELVSVCLLDEELAEELKEEGVTITVTFDLGVSAEAEVAVFSYVDGEWIEAVSVTNNGDGTVTVEFEDICPVAFAVKE